MTFWPPWVFILTRKPWVFFLLLLFGWNVLFIISTHIRKTMLIKPDLSVKLESISSPERSIPSPKQKSILVDSRDIFGYNPGDEFVQDWG
jgi:hypothetical protein